MQQSKRETVAVAGAWGSVFAAVFIRVKGSVTIWKPFMGKLASSQYCKFALLTFWLVSSPSTAVETWETFAANHVKCRCNKSGCSGLVPTGKCGNGGKNHSSFSDGISEYLLCGVLPQTSPPFPAKFQPITAIAFPLGNHRFPTFFFLNPQCHCVNDNNSAISLQDQDQSMVFLSLKSKPLITADCAKWKGFSLCQCPDSSRGIFSIYLPLPLGDLECVGCTGSGGREEGARALVPRSCHACAQVFPKSKSAELVTTEALKSLWQMWAWSLIPFFFFRGRSAVCLHSCLLFITWGINNNMGCS